MKPETSKATKTTHIDVDQYVRIELEASNSTPMDLYPLQMTYRNALMLFKYSRLFRCLEYASSSGLGLVLVQRNYTLKYSRLWSMTSLLRNCAKHGWLLNELKNRMTAAWLTYTFVMSWSQISVRDNDLLQNSNRRLSYTTFAVPELLSRQLSSGLRQRTSWALYGISWPRFWKWASENIFVIPAVSDCHPSSGSNKAYYRWAEGLTGKGKSKHCWMHRVTCKSALSYP